MIIRSVMQVNIGQMNDKKINKISGILSTRFKSGVSEEMQIIGVNENEQIRVCEHSIEWIFNSENEIESIFEIYNKLFEAMLIDNNISMLEIRLTEVLGDNYTLEYLKEKYKCGMKNSIAIGIKNFFEFHGNLVEIRVEPYFAESNKIYCEASYPMKNIDVNCIEKCIKDIIEDYNTKRNDLEL